MDRILITGASGELGAALAQHYAAPGRRLLLWGRDRDRLATTAAACRAAGAEVTVRSLDIADIEQAVSAVRAEDAAHQISLALFVAGVGDVRPEGLAVEAPEQVARLGLVNFVAPCAMANALAQRMVERRGGTIAFIGSAAAFHALPSAAAYSASKAGLARFAEALRVGIAPSGVRVVLVSPGFIDTAAGRSVAGPKPLVMSPVQAAVRIADAIGRGRRHVIVPRAFGWLRVIDRLLPAPLRDRVLRAVAP